MPIGVIIDCLGVFIGGLIGAAIGHSLPEKLKTPMTVILGFFSMAIGIRSIVATNDMTAPILAIIIAFIIGTTINLEGNLQNGIISLVRKARIPGQDQMDISLFSSAISIFCCSAVGWYGSMLESVSGDHTILFTKAVMDAVSAAILASSLGAVVSMISIFQFIIFMSFFCFGRVINPLCTSEMILDFSACGGLIALMNGFRMSKVKEIPVLNMLLGLLLVLPLSALWRTIVG